MPNVEDYLRSHIAAVPDFPHAGILFRDITPLLADGKGFALATKELAARAPDGADAVAGVESRGFIFGAAVARELGLPFAPVRKPGKLPRESLSESYQLEYGEDSLHLHADAFAAEARVFLVDDLIATGGTLIAAARLVERQGATVAGAACLIELADLGGRARYGRPLQAVLEY